MKSVYCREKERERERQTDRDRDRQRQREIAREITMMSILCILPNAPINNVFCTKFQITVAVKVNDN